MGTLTRRGLLGAASATTAFGAVAAGPGVASALAVETADSALGFYVSTMDPANTGAANAAAFEADVAAAEGRQVLVPPSTTPYTIGAVSITGETINVRFMPGSLLVPDASLHAVGGRMFHATACNTRLYGLVVDGQNVPENCWRSDGGEFRAYDTTMTNMGFLDIPGTAASLGTLGILCKDVDEVIIDGYTGRDFVGRKDGVFANNAGKVNHIMVYECESVAIRNVTISGGEGEDNDFFHILDLRPTPAMHGTIESCHLFYNGQTRRCMKFQGGNWSARDIHCRPGDDFESVEPGVTDVGEQNLNCIDWAGSIEGELRITDSYVDATGFVVGVSHTFGPLGKVIAENCTIVGSRLRAIRTNPEPPHNAQDIQCMGFFGITSENESEIRNCVIKGFSRAVVVQGNRTRVTGNVIDDPQDLWFQGGSSLARDFLEVSNNKVYTRTPGAMAAGRCSRIDNYTNLECHGNTLIRAGNTAHAAVFVDVTNPNAVGFANNNRAPAGTVPFRSGAANVAVYQNQGHLLRPLFTTTNVGSIATSETNLHSHLIPPYNLERAGAAVRTTFTGMTADNANAKTLRVYVGTTLAMETSLNASQAGAWEVQVVLIALDSGSQKHTVKLIECASAGSAAPTVCDMTIGTSSEATTASIILKVTGQGVATNDIVSQAAVSESLDGRHFVFT